MPHNITARELIEFYANGIRKFRNADLRGADLRQVNLSEADLQGSYLRWAELQGAMLDNANLTWADLQRANLSDASLNKAMLSEANLRSCNLQWTDFQEAQLKGAALIGSNLACSNLRGASLRLANLKGANLDQARLVEADLRVATLVEAKLLDADLQGAKLQEANSIGANLMGANLQGANLMGASFQEAKLNRANLQWANLQGASLQRADLQEAKLFGANLTGANLMETKLPSLVNMQGAQLQGAQLKGVKLPKGENLEAAMLPNGSIPYEETSNSQTRGSLAPSSAKSSSLSGKKANKSPENNLGSNSPTKTLLSDSNLITYNGKVIGSQEQLLYRSRLLTAAEQRLDLDGGLKTSSITIAHRRGPSNLRQGLLAAYNRQCAISSCNAEPVLEATLLIPNSLQHNFQVSDGLLLRADIHTLFDLYLIAIEPDTMRVLVAPSLQETSYGEFHSQLLQTPLLEEFKPNKRALQWHYNWCQWLKE
ncbi:MAG: hypothetical protein F6J93_03240 [Oscillatoria sp. SIO1A7]|nr:hypothetical protein [Oscillatoria sp. SIO1A7]